MPTGEKLDKKRKTMSVDGFKRFFEPLKILTESQVQEIHSGTLRVLERTGLAFHDERALNLFADHGCKVDFRTKRVRFPKFMVEDCLTKCPHKFRIKARAQENDLELTGRGNTVYFAPSPAMKTVNLNDFSPREPTRKDFYDYIRVLDYLPHVHMQNSFPYFGFAKVPQCMRLLESNAAKLRISTKVQKEGSILGNDLWNIEMAKATKQDLLNTVNPASPLTFYEDTVSAIFRYSEQEIPFHIASGVLAGSTAPATVAGLVLLNNAEILAGMMLAQLIRSGTRVWVGNFVNMQNMSTGTPAFGDIGNSLSEVVLNQVWREYGIPTFSTAPAWTSSKAIDFQAGYEMSLAALSSALSGACTIFFQGGLTGEFTAHPVKAILDDDVAGMIGRFLQGIETSEENMAIESINDVGPIPGHFLDTEHTFKWWRKDQFMPKVADRLPYSEWSDSGKKDALSHAKEKLEHILSTYKPTLLPPEQEQAIEDILKDAREFYRKKGEISEDEWKLYQEDLGSTNYPYE
jgi:trimethylamine--corrinoid protein Co-methyltransferase